MGGTPSSQGSGNLFIRANARAIAAALFSGGVLQFISAPTGLGWLHWFSFVPLLVTLPGRARPDFKLGYLCGFTGVFFLFFWLAQTIDLFSNIPLPLAMLLLVLFAAVWGLPYGVAALCARPLRARFGAGWVFFFPACWVAVELLQPALFPYYMGVSQYRTPLVWQLASVVGVYGLSYLVLLTNCALAEITLARAGPRSLVIAAVVTALWLGNVGFGSWRYAWVSADIAAAPTVRAAILQQGVTMIQRLQDRGPEVLKSWLDLTGKVIGQRPDLVVWPEGSIHGNPHEGGVRTLLSRLAKENGFDFLVGGGTTQRDRVDPRKYTSWNSCYLFGRDGELRGRYDKMVPLPFGEYLPWPISYLSPYIEGVGNFRAGEQATVFDTGRYTFTAPICYEAILEGQMRRLMHADLFVNITNDGWFGDTAALHQHAMLAAAHAVELGRPILRIAYTGISMLILPNGDIRHETRPYTEAAQVVEVPLARFETPYRTWGRFFPWVCTAAALIALARARRPVQGAAPP